MANLKDLLNKYSNGVAKFEYNNEKEREYIKLGELDSSKTYPIEALFINTKGKFGNQGVIISGDYIVNCPQHLTEMIEDMRQDEEMVEAINQRLFDFEIYEFESKKYNRKSHGINLVPSENVQQEAQSEKSRKRATQPVRSK
ncbi:hypothetical protein CoNPh32_CDS0006 [Staphylococcus phage S-CoN_Ph32]|nr:hypothetical protein CoNPh32_CDS0006 [Staphylococcus phage S-CoN_Ph32]